MRQNWHKSRRNPENPVETGQIRLTNPLERLKVVLGTVVGTPINKGDFGIGKDFLPPRLRAAGQ
jgi:hypothetical protein